MKKVKIITVRDDPSKAEEEIARWQQNNPNIDLLQLSATETGNRESGFRYTIAVLFNETLGSTGEIYPVKRVDERKELFQIVDYSVGGRMYRDFILDMSASGLFIRTGRKFEIGQKISMTFMAPDQGESFRIQGEIVRALPEGIGIRFNKASQVQDELIRSYIQNLEKD